MPKRDDFTTLTTPGSKKISICARRVGSRDRMSVIAVCTDETRADTIVEALNLRQGAIDKLEAPAQKTLEEVRELLDRERQGSRTQAGKIIELEQKLRSSNTERDQAKAELSTVRGQRDRLQTEVSDLKAKAAAPAEA